MKNRKRWLSVILTLAMVFTLCITPAAAVGADNENGATITVEKVTGEYTIGSEVTLEVSIAGNPGFAGFTFEVIYDAGKLTLKEITQGTVTGGMFMPNPGKNKVVLANSENLEGDGTLFTLKFTVNEAGVDGAAVTVKADKLRNVAKEDVAVTILAGGINDTTGGSTTGGSTTGGSTTGGSTTGGSTTGGSTTGGGTTGGGTTGGGSTGGGSTGGGSSSGSGSSYTSGMSFTTDLPADSITRVTVNGKKLDSKYYTVSSNGSGSIVTLTDAYLATLKAGTYTIKIENATHVSTGTFTIKADGTPKTADAGIALYAVMAVSSLMGTAVVSKKCRKA